MRKKAPDIEKLSGEEVIALLLEVAFSAELRLRTKRRVGPAAWHSVDPVLDAAVQAQRSMKFRDDPMRVSEVPRKAVELKGVRVKILKAQKKKPTKKLSR